MTDKKNVQTTFDTVAMAEILLVQDLVKEASQVIGRLEKQYPGDKRVVALRHRMSSKMDTEEAAAVSVEQTGIDRIELIKQDDILNILWELTDDGLAIAKRQVRYSGFIIVRVFTATSGPRGIRTTIKDHHLENCCEKMEIAGVPKIAVHTAAVGFLGRNGAFVPMASAKPVS